MTIVKCTLELRSAFAKSVRCPNKATVFFMADGEPYARCKMHERLIAGNRRDKIDHIKKISMDEYIALSVHES